MQLSEFLLEEASWRSSPGLNNVLGATEFEMGHGNHPERYSQEEQAANYQFSETKLYELPWGSVISWLAR